MFEAIVALSVFVFAIGLTIIIFNPFQMKSCYKQSSVALSLMGISFLLLTIAYMIVDQPASAFASSAIMLISFGSAFYSYLLENGKEFI